MVDLDLRQQVLEAAAFIRKNRLFNMGPFLIRESDLIEENKAMVEPISDEKLHLIEACVNSCANNEDVHNRWTLLKGDEGIALIARLRQAETALAKARNDALDEAIQACQKQALAFLDRGYAGPNPMNSFSERFACGECVNAIHALKEAPSAP